MSYGHAERNLALIRQLETETRQLFGSLAQSSKSSFQNPPVRGARRQTPRSGVHV